MRDDMLPLFPLSVVLLPHNELPLHIHEDRYKEMIRSVMEERAEFGVVMTAPQGIVATGCTASVEQVIKEYADGRMDIVTLGRRRFRVELLNQDKDFLRAEVRFFEDADSAAPEGLRKQAVRICADLPAPSLLISEAGVDSDDPELSFLLARPIGDLDFRQQLLMMRSEAERLHKLVEYVPVYITRQKQSERMRELAPKNGHGIKPRDLD